MTVVPADLAFLQWLLVECNYQHPRLLPGNRWAAIARKAFTHAIITGQVGDYCTIEKNWCYETYAQARAAMNEWSGTGEPKGWFRDTTTGRRISRDPDERDENGKRIGAIGVPYVRY